MPDARRDEQSRIRELGSGSAERTGDACASKLDPGDDPKGWDRASIALSSHPLHPFPRVSQADLLLPSADDRLKLAGDSLIFGTCMALLAFFPLWMMDVLANGAWANWVWGSMAVIGVVSAVWLYFYVPISTSKHLRKL